MHRWLQLPKTEETEPSMVPFVMVGICMAMITMQMANSVRNLEWSTRLQPVSIIPGFDGRWPVLIELELEEVVRIKDTPWKHEREGELDDLNRLLKGHDFREHPSVTLRVHPAVTGGALIEAVDQLRLSGARINLQLASTQP